MLSTRLVVPASLVSVALAVSLSACGGSSSSSSTQARGNGDPELAVIRSNEVLQSRKASPHAAKAAPRAHDPVTTSTKPSRARGTEDGPNDEFNASGAKPVNPCKLVTRAEARAIVGRPIVRAWQAPQGPTCIYQVRGAKSYVTLALQKTNFAAVRKHARTLSHGTVRGRPTSCLKLGTTMTVTRLSGGREIQITASCAIGKRFASKALTRL
jgi:hypothetical protein